MKCFDNGHTYEMDTMMGDRMIYPMPVLDGRGIHFYEMRPDGIRIDGVTNEEVLKVLIHRLNVLNSGKYKCQENSIAITSLETALMWLEKRTADREARKVEGTMEV